MRQTKTRPETTNIFKEKCVVAYKRHSINASVVVVYLRKARIYKHLSPALSLKEREAVLSELQGGVFTPANKTSLPGLSLLYLNKEIYQLFYLLHLFFSIIIVFSNRYLSIKVR